MLAALPAWTDALLTFVIAVCALRLVWVDIRRLEIEFETLGVMAALALVQSCLSAGVVETCIRIFAGLAFYLTLVFASQRFGRLARYGAGDPPLIGVLGFLVAPMVLPWALLSGLFMFLTCGWYAHRRGKRPFRSMYPAAPPLILAALCIYLPA